MTPSIRSAVTDLRLDKSWLICPGKQRDELRDRLTALPFVAALEMKFAKEMPLSQATAFRRRDFVLRNHCSLEQTFPNRSRLNSPNNCILRN